MEIHGYKVRNTEDLFMTNRVYLHNGYYRHFTKQGMLINDFFKAFKLCPQAYCDSRLTLIVLNDVGAIEFHISTLMVECFPLLNEAQLAEKQMMTVWHRLYNEARKENKYPSDKHLDYVEAKRFFNKQNKIFSDKVNEIKQHMISQIESQTVND